MNPIDKDLENIKDNIESNTIDRIKDALDNLISENDGLKDDDNDYGNTNSKSDSNSDSQSKSDSNSKQSGSSTKRSTTSSTSSCASTETALHITVLCKPTTLTTLGSTVTTTTCSPSTTVTTHGCSVTAFTTTISSTTSANATRTPCSSGTCGAACPLQNDGPLNGASMVVVSTTAQCALISTITTSALPTGSYKTIGSMTVASPTPQSVAASATAPTKRWVSGNPASYMYNETMTAGSLDRRTLPEPPNYSLYVSELSYDLIEKNKWSSQAGDTSGN